LFETRQLLAQVFGFFVVFFVFVCFFEVVAVLVLFLQPVYLADEFLLLLGSLAEAWRSAGSELRSVSDDEAFGCLAGATHG